MPVIVVAQDEWSPKPEVAQDRFYCIDKVSQYTGGIADNCFIKIVCIYLIPLLKSEIL